MAEAQTTNEPKRNLKFFGKKKVDKQDADQPEAAVATLDREKEEIKPEPEAVANAQPKEKELMQPTKAQTLPLKTMLMPTVAFAIRTLLILAIILADAFAAYYIVAKALAPRLIEARVVRMMREAEEPKEEPKEEAADKSKEAAKQAIGSITPIADVIVNPLATSGTRYLCTTVAFEAVVPAVGEEIKTREHQIRDMLIEILGGRTVEELSNLTVREQIREEIKNNVNGLLQSGQVTGVYFANFVLQ